MNLVYELIMKSNQFLTSLLIGVIFYGQQYLSSKSNFGKLSNKDQYQKLNISRYKNATNLAFFYLCQAINLVIIQVHLQGLRDPFIRQTNNLLLKPFLLYFHRLNLLTNLQINYIQIQMISTKNYQQHLKQTKSPNKAENNSIASFKLQKSNKFTSQHPQDYQPNSSLSQSLHNDQIQNQSIHSNRIPSFGEKEVLSSMTNLKMKNSNLTEEMTFNSLKNCRSTMLRSLVESVESLHQLRMSEAMNPSLVKSIKSSHPEQFLIRQTENVRLCKNGDMKKAKYRVVSTNDFMCSKCAIVLLQKGFKIEQLRDPSVLNKNQFCKLFERIQLTEQTISQDLQESSTIEMKEHLKNMFQKQMKLFDDIEQAIRKMKVASVQKYQAIQSKVETQLFNERKHLSQKLQFIQIVKRDIMKFKLQQRHKTESQMFLKELQNQMDVIQKYDRLEFKLKNQPIDEQLQAIVKNIYKHLNLPQNQFPTNLVSSLRSSLCQDSNSRKNLFTKIIRQSKARK